MKDILDDIMEFKKIEVEQQKLNLPPAELYRRVEQMKADASLRPRRSMSRALASSDTGIIAEFKRRSPSKGWIKESASLERIAGGYALNGASALSVLTDERYFGGNLDFLRTVASMVDVPCRPAYCLVPLSRVMHGIGFKGARARHGSFA